MLNLDLIIRLSGLALQAWLAVILLRHKLYRRFPFFTAYVIYGVATAVARTIVAQIDPTTYFYVFFGTEALYALLGLAAIYEAFKEIFEPLYDSWWFRPLLALVVLGTLGYSIWRAIYHSPVQAYIFGGLVLSLEIGVRYIQGGIFALCWVTYRFFKLTPSRYPLGIVDGFGIAAIGILAGSLFRSSFGIRFNTFFRFVPAVSYIVAVLIWLAALRGPETEPGEDTPSVPLPLLRGIRDELRRSLEEAKRIGKNRWKRIRLRYS
jgi:hypothetical protein